eukprot:TRINITY_DN1874_c0_g1_i2.p1 TRINITY_DN1874_c0_g1~~TRINITY_DN1874_c0_g1_i2.p1  ORF type:complete len:579 (-),score=111.37 TRINITY_DN1874_c0_g1_i2:784-2520(-)
MELILGKNDAQAKLIPTIPQAQADTLLESCKRVEVQSNGAIKEVEISSKKAESSEKPYGVNEIVIVTEEDKYEATCISINPHVNAVCDNKIDDDLLKEFDATSSDKNIEIENDRTPIIEREADLLQPVTHSEDIKGNVFSNRGDDNAISHFEESIKNVETDKEPPKENTHNGAIGKNEDFMYIIKDTITGATYDIRDQCCVSMLDNEQFSKLSGVDMKTVWQDWWEAKRDRNNQLLSAIEKGNLKEVSGLLDRKVHGDLIADIDTKSLDDFTPLHIAVSEGYHDVVLFLLSCKAFVDALTTSLRTPLHIACNRGNLQIIQTLVKSKANINAQDADGNTPAHMLSSAGHGEALSWFLEQKPDLDLRNMYNETAMETSGSVEVRQIFGMVVKVGKEDSYSRIVMENVILHNNRADMIKSFMFKAQMMNGKKVEEIPRVEPKTPKGDKASSRVVKILEAAEKLKSITPDKLKSLSVHTAPQGNALYKRVEDKIVSMKDFEIYSLLGKGSFGEVYLVKYKGDGKFYAMKTLNKKKVVMQNSIKYARTERNVLRISKHPFIVGLHFAFQSSEKLFMIMKYCPG